MARINAPMQAFNRGEVSALALARTDVDRLRLAAAEQINWLPRTIGPMMLRPGLEYIGEIYQDHPCTLIPFVFAQDDTALIEATSQLLRFWVDDVLVTRASVSSAVTSGDFSASTGWTLTATSPASATISSNLLQLTGANGQRATGEATVTVANADKNVRHALRIVVDRGPVLFRCGSTAGDDDYIAETSLDEGTHSLALTPTGDFHLWFANDLLIVKRVSSVEVEASGVMTLPTPWRVADLPNIRVQQSADVLFCACNGNQQRRIERRASDSWSIVLYKADDGPFTVNSGVTTLTPAALNGNTTLTASNPLFKSSHVGALFRLFHSGQTAQDDLSTENTFTNAVRVTGVTPNAKRANDDQRVITIKIRGTWVGTLTLESSTDGATTGFAAADPTATSGPTTFTANGNYTFSDGLDNAIVWYRVGFETGDYTSGTANITITFASGGGSGVCRVTGYTSSTEVAVEVLAPSDDLSGFKNTTATVNWYEGTWSNLRGWPDAPTIHGGRLWWAGNDRIWGSISDDYSSFNFDILGDSGVIDRSIGSGPIANIRWMLSLQQELIFGSDMATIGALSPSFGEPLTPTNFSLLQNTTQGVAALPAGQIDGIGIMVQAAGRRVYALAWDFATQQYKPHDLTRLNLDIGIPGFAWLAVQRQPDTRIILPRVDTDAACLLYDPEDEVEAWWRIQTSGTIEMVAVLPGTLEDQVYCVVNRTINGATVRYLEKFAIIDDCDGQPVSKCADAFILDTSNSTTISGLSHLEGCSVVAWGWNNADTAGTDLGTFTVSSGSIALTKAFHNVVVGLPYTATFQSAKLAYAAQMGTALTQPKRVDHLGLILANTHYQGLQYGPDLDNLDELPLIESDEATASNTMWATYDQRMLEFDGTWDTDSRICLVATAPRPCTVLGAVVGMTTMEKA